jgi:hypothetical protein
MRSSTVIIAVQLLAIPLAAGRMQLAQNATGVPDQTVHGQTLTDAPVSPLSPSVKPGVAAVDRAAGEGLRSSNAGPPDSTPFSGAPSGTLTNGAQADVHDREDAPSSGDVTPHLGR